MYYNRANRIPRNNQSQIQKPTFNVVEPFMGVLMVQLNHAMSIELQKFISSIEDVDEEVEALKMALRDPAQNGVFVYKEGPSFVVTRSFKGVVLVEMNQEMRDILIQFISYIQGGVDKIIWAFRLALENPEGSRDNRNRRRTEYTRRRRSNDDYVYQEGDDEEEYYDDDEYVDEDPRNHQADDEEEKEDKANPYYKKVEE